MATFTDCADNLTCATLSGSNGIGVGLVTGTPNKIVVSASNIPNSALANNSININGTTIALGTTGSLAIGDITAVTAGTNLTGGGTSGSLTVSLTSSITGGLTNISGLTTLSSSQVSGTFSGSLLGTASYATLAGTAATASYVATGSAIATFTNDVRNQFRAGSNIGISAGVISLSSSVSTAALSGTTGVSGTLGLFTNLTGTNISGSRISGSFSGSGALINNLTASNISNFTNDVRAQFSAGTNITINNGVISASGGGGGGSGTINTGSAGYVTYYPSTGTTVDDASGSTGGLYWDNANIRLGVNTTSPAYRLDVAGTGRFTSNVEVTGTIKSTSTIYAPGIDLSNSTGYANIEIGGPSGGHIDLKRPYTDDYDIRLISDNNIEGGGYLIASGGAILALSGTGVAVGQYSSAGYKFLVAGTTRLADAVEIGQNGTLRLYDNATQVVVQYPNKQVSFYDSSAGASRMLIDTNGEVGIGTTAPTELLTVASGSNDRVGIDVQSVTSSIYFGSNTAGAARQLEFDRSTGLFKFKGRPASGVFADNVTIDINGNVGIGTTNPARPLQVGNESGQQVVRIAGGSGGTASGSALYLGAGSGLDIYALGHYSAINGGAYNDTLTLYAADGRPVYMQCGNVGIGISTPATKLDVNGEVTVRGNRILHSSSNYQTEFGPGAGIGTPSENYGIYAPAGKRLVLNTGDGSQIFLSGSNVGIGTSIPTYKLQVNGTISGTAVYGLSGSSAQFPNFTNDVRAQFTAGTNITITNGQIDATGGGVGTISPGNQYRLAYYSDVDGGTTINYASNLVYDNNALGIGYPPTGKYKLEVSGNGLFSKTVFTSLPATYFNDWMLQIHREQSNSALKESGHLVLTAPDADGTAAALYFGISGSTTNNTYSWIQSRLPTTDTGDERILSLNPNGGSVGIGTTTPNSAYKLDVAGTGRFTSNVEITGTLKAVTQLTASSISSSTNITTGKIYFTPVVSGFDSYLCIKNSNGEIVRETSDARLKENITYFDNQEMLNVALQLKPAKYSWIERENPEEIDVGFIAQDVLSVFPPAVGAEYQGYYGFKINKIIPVAIGAIKQLKQENDELKQKLNEVLTRLSALENK